MPTLPIPIQINLPLGILLHASVLTTLGLYLTLFPTSKNSGPLGVATLGIGLAYFSTAYVPMEQNQFLYASVPVRLVLAFVAGVRAFMLRGSPSKDAKDAKGKEGWEREERERREERRALWGIVLLDGLGGLGLGMWLGVWNGRVAGY